MDFNQEQILSAFQQAHSLTELIELKNKFLKQIITPLKQSIPTLTDAQAKKTLGLKINNLKEQINHLFLQVKDEMFNVPQTVFLPSLDASKQLELGHEHLLTQINNTILNIFKELGFDIKYGADVLDTYWNFDVLNIPNNHPARAAHDSFFFNPHTILKTHNTSWSAKYLSQNRHRDDIRICSYGPVYRNDDDDATHSHQFMQIDLVWVKKGLNVANLKWLVDHMLKRLFGQDIQTRYRLSFFPFTEPSFEVDVSCFNCHGQGCNICKHSTWIEILGAGMLHQNVLRNLGFDSQEYSGLAFGIGIERIAMLKAQIEDIRSFYTNDFDFLKQF